MNIDYLRTLCAIFVVFEHFCETTAHNAFGFSLESSIVAHVILRVLYSFARTAVPLFFLISGYLSIQSQRQKVGKVITLFAMTYFYGQVSTLFSTAYYGDFEIISLLMRIIKGLFVRNYYLYLFSAVYIVSPFVNNAIKHFSREQYRRLIFVLFLLFSVWSTVINTVIGHREITGAFFTSRTGTSMGFNFVNFLMLYLIGGYFRIYFEGDFKQLKLMATVSILCSSLITVSAKMISTRFSVAFWYYDSLFVVISAVSLFVLFMDIDLKQNAVVAFTGCSTFGTYLIHGFASACIEHFISIETVVKRGFWGSFEGIIIFVVGVYLLALTMTATISVFSSPINKWWKTTKLYNTYIGIPS